MKTEVPGNARREIKFVADETEADRLIHWLKVHPAGFREAYPARWINSIYFDTHDLWTYRQNLAGASERHKVRYRWYGPARLPGPGAFEVKCKRNYFGWKLRFPVRRLSIAAGGRWHDFVVQVTDELPAEGRIWLHACPRPTLLVRYMRYYFETPDRRMRATVDQHQEMFDQRYKPYLNITRASNIPRTVVFELKFERKDRLLAARLLSGFPVRVSRHSKYVAGLRSVQGF